MGGLSPVQQLVFRVRLSHSLQPPTAISNEVEGERDGRAVAVAVARMMMPVDLLFLPSFLPPLVRPFASDESAKDHFGRRKSTARQTAETATPNIQPASQFACPLKQGLVGYMDM